MARTFSIIRDRVRVFAAAEEILVRKPNGLLVSRAFGFGAGIHLAKVQRLFAANQRDKLRLLSVPERGQYGTLCDRTQSDDGKSHFRATFHSTGVSAFAIRTAKPLVANCFVIQA